MCIYTYIHTTSYGYKLNIDINQNSKGIFYIQRMQHWFEDMNNHCKLRFVPKWQTSKLFQPLDVKGYI